MRQRFLSRFHFTVMKGHEMIEGLRLRVTSNELKKHCMDRSAYHSRRADEKEATLPELQKSMDLIKGQTATAVAQFSKGGYHLDADDPVKNLKADIKDHKNKSLVFAFFADHLFDEDYNLQENDLQRLEILKR